MKSIKKEVIYQTVINKSNFINYLIPVSSIDDVNSELKNLRKKYPDASHHCFAYLLGKRQDIQKFSDDGEPSKTAGFPMLEVLKKNELTDVLNVSIRYFGGVKLGAGGLVRAYTKGCAEAVKLAELSSLTAFTVMDVTIPFDYIGAIEKYLRDNYTLLDTTYDTKVHYKIELKQLYNRDVTSAIPEKTNGTGTIFVLDTYEKYV